MVEVLVRYSIPCRTGGCRGPAWLKSIYVADTAQVWYCHCEKCRERSKDYETEDWALRNWYLWSGMDMMIIFGEYQEEVIELEFRVPCGCRGMIQVRCIERDEVRTWNGTCNGCGKATETFTDFDEFLRVLWKHDEGLIFIADEKQFERQLVGMQHFLKFFERKDELTFTLVFRWQHCLNGVFEKKLHTEIHDNVRLTNLLVGVVMEEELDETEYLM